jgi:hypothetical protein
MVANFGKVRTCEVRKVVARATFVASSAFPVTLFHVKYFPGSTTHSGERRVRFERVSPYRVALAIFPGNEGVALSKYRPNEIGVGIAGYKERTRLGSLRLSVLPDAKSDPYFVGAVLRRRLVRMRKIEVVFEGVDGELGAVGEGEFL